jgi:transposase
MSLPKHRPQRSLFEVDMLFSELFDSNPAADRFSFFAEKILPQLHALCPKLEGMYCEDNGRPGEDPVRMLGVVLLQFMERKPDREAVQCCTFDLRWKLALGMEAGEKAFHSTSLVRFRQRLLDHGFESLGFQAALEAMREAGYLGRKNQRQRLDSTHVVGLISRMSRLENIRETMRLALEGLEKQSDLARPEGWPLWWERYVESKPDYRIDKTELQKRFEQAGEDVQALLGWIEAVLDEPDRPNSVRLLGRVFDENFETSESGSCVSRRAQPPGAVHNPHDPEAQWSSKSTTKDKEWVGYKAQVAETVASTICQPGEPTANVITALMTQEAITSDKATLSLVEREWEQRRVEKPNILYVDGGYTSGAELAHAKEEGRQLQGPMARAPVKDKRYSSEQFEVCVEERRAICPGEKTNSQCSRLQDAKTGKITYRFEFRRGDCGQCPMKPKCLGKEQKHRTLVVGEHYTLIQSRRQEQTTQAFQEDMHHRNGVEGTISELVRAHGLRRSRYRGLAKTRLQNYMIGAACNIRRWSARTSWQSRQTTS